MINWKSIIDLQGSIELDKLDYKNYNFNFNKISLIFSLLFVITTFLI